MPFDQTPQTDAALDAHLQTPDHNDGDVDPTKLAYFYMAFAVFVAVMVASVSIFGLPGLYIPAVAAVPFCFVCLLLITVGK